MGFVTDTLGLTSRDPVQSNFVGKEAQLDNPEIAPYLSHAIAQQRGIATDDAWGKLQGALSQQAAGQGGPSVAETMLNRGLDKNIGASASMAASQRGTNPAMAARMAMNAQQQAMGDTAGQASTMRAQEQMAAQQNLGNFLQTRSQLAGQNVSSLGSLVNQQNQNRISNAGMAQGLNQSTQNANTNLAAENQASRGQVIGGMISGGSQMLTSGLGGGGGGGGAANPGTFANPGPRATGATYAEGGMVPGDHPQNDTVPAMLSPGEIVLPRSITQSPDAAIKAMAFVEAIKKSKGKK